MSKAKPPRNNPFTTPLISQKDEIHAVDIETIKLLAIMRNAPHFLIPKNEINKIQNLLKLRFSLLETAAQDSALLSRQSRQLRLMKAYLLQLKKKIFKRRKRIADLINKEEEETQRKYLEEFEQHLENMSKRDRINITQTFSTEFKIYINAENILASTTLLAIFGLSESYRNDLEIALSQYQQDPTPTAFKALPRGLQLMTAGQMHDGTETLDSHEVLSRYFPNLIDLISIKADEITQKVLALELPQPQRSPDDHDLNNLIRARTHSLLVATHLIGKDDPEANPAVTDDTRIHETTKNILSNPLHLEQIATVVQAATIFRASLAKDAAQRDSILSNPLVTGMKPRPQGSLDNDNKDKEEEEQKETIRRSIRPNPLNPFSTKF